MGLQGKSASLGGLTLLFVVFFYFNKPRRGIVPSVSAME